MTNAEVVINWGNDENSILIGQSTVHVKNVKKTTKRFNLYNMFRQKLLPSSVTRDKAMEVEFTISRKC